MHCGRATEPSSVALLLGGVEEKDFTARMVRRQKGIAPPPPFPLPRGNPCALGCPSATPDNGLPTQGTLHVPAEAGGACVVVLLNPPVLHSGLS